MSKKRTVEVVLTVEIPDSKDTTNETVATFFNWEICHRVSAKSQKWISQDLRKKR